MYFFDYTHAIHLWKVDKLDFFTWFTCFVVTLFVGVDIGIGVSVVLSLLFVLYESAYPHTAVLGRLHESSVYRNVKQYPDAQEFNGIVIMRFDAPLYFANADFTRDVSYPLLLLDVLKFEILNTNLILVLFILLFEIIEIQKMDEYVKKKAAASNLPIKYIILDMAPVSYVDSSGLQTLEDILVGYKKLDVTLLICNPNRPVMDKLVLSDMVEQIGHDNFFVSVHDAVNYCLKKIIDDGEIFIEEGTGHKSFTNNDDGDNGGVLQETKL